MSTDSPKTPQTKAAMEAQAFMEEMRKLHKAKVPEGLRLMSDMTVQNLPRLSTGSLLFNDILDGGYPCGHMTEIYGPESSGKTTLAIHAMVEGQKTGRAVGLIDAEHTFDLQYAMNLGLDTAATVLEHPMCAEEALDTLSAMIRSGHFSVIVLDSVAALAPRAEIEGHSGQSHVGLVPRLMGQFIRANTSDVQKSGTVVIFINQIREKIGVMFGNPETQPGGRALKFQASVRVDIRRIGTDKDGDDPTANRVRIRVVKNKTGIPLRQAETRIIFGKGIDVTGEVIEMAERAGRLVRKGAWYSFLRVNPETGEETEERIGQGIASVIDKVENDPEFYDLLTNALLEPA